MRRRSHVPAWSLAAARALVYRSRICRPWIRVLGILLWNRLAWAYPPRMETEAAAAGWYLDPDNASILRWWDGQSWSEARMPVPVASRGDRVGDGVGLLLLAFVGLLVLAVVWYVAVYVD